MSSSLSSLSILHIHLPSWPSALWTSNSSIRLTELFNHSYIYILLIIRKKTKIPLTPLLFSILLEALTNTNRKRIQEYATFFNNLVIEMQRIKPSICRYMVLCLENLRRHYFNLQKQKGRGKKNLRINLRNTWNPDEAKFWSIEKPQSRLKPIERHTACW